MLKLLYWNLRGYIGKYFGCNVYKRKRKLIFVAEKEEYIDGALDKILSQFSINSF